MNDALVLSEIHPSGYAVLTLNRPSALNALSRALMAQLSDAIDALQADPTVRVLVLTGAGKAFCAGLDLKELGSGQAGLGAGENGVTARDPVAALACDVLLASPLARFADTHARIGVAPGWGLSQRLSRAIGIYRAREVSLTGNWVSAEQAAAWGFVNRVVPAEGLLDAARQLAGDMLSCVPEMLPRYKAIIDDGFALPFGQGMRLERARSREFNAGVGAAAVEARRESVRARNRG